MKGAPLAPGKATVDDMPTTFELRESQLPQLKGWKIGNKYRLIMEAEMVGQDKGYDGSSPHQGRFKVTSVKAAGEAKSDKADQPAPSSRADKIARLSDKSKEV